MFDAQQEMQTLHNGPRAVAANVTRAPARGSKILYSAVSLPRPPPGDAIITPGLKLTTTSQLARRQDADSCHFNYLFITGKRRLLEQTPATQRREAKPGIKVKSRLASAVKTRQTRVMPGDDDGGWKGPAHPPKLPSVCPIIKFFHY